MIRKRKPRTTSRQSHDVQEWNHPLAVGKAMRRQAAGLCIGCGKKPCTCKSKGDQ